MAWPSQANTGLVGTEERPNLIPIHFTRGLRACRRCRLIKQEEQWYRNGCENCKSFSTMDRGAVMEHTTQHFEGFISLADPGDSWVAKWNHLKKCLPGCYAFRVVGEEGGPQEEPDEYEED
eukprot:TRINITY_DN14998_c0_g1_i1.p1 TRINITY_DN14998_c0_g1~~TRINITY_DN14998_c0_g1_i1.p1  ORF type:complete len:121 (+),score=17.53 TRINITY_DN14998_c0_g1_i1:26-388(+)